jgi:hypothetical protein
MQKRKKREYRLQRKRQFQRPEPGFSLYEGRTRGKRAKYTFSDDENEFGSDSTNRRSMRNTRAHTPAEGITTMSGRQIRPPRDRMAPEASGSAAGSVHGDGEEHSTADEVSFGPTGRPRRSAAVQQSANGWAGKSTRSRGRGAVVEDDDDEEEGTDFDGDDENDEDEHVPEDSEEEEEEDDYDEVEAMDEDDLDGQPAQSRIIKIKVSPAALNRVLTMTPPLSTPEKGARHAADHVIDMTDAPVLDSITLAPQNYTPASSAGRYGTPEPAAKAVAIPVTPSAAVGTTPLAFRGSPEKHPQQAQRPIDVGGRK